MDLAGNGRCIIQRSRGEQVDGRPVNPNVAHVRTWAVALVVFHPSHPSQGHTVPLVPYQDHLTRWAIAQVVLPPRSRLTSRWTSTYTVPTGDRRQDTRHAAEATVGHSARGRHDCTRPTPPRSSAGCCSRSGHSPGSTVNHDAIVRQWAAAVATREKRGLRQIRVAH